MLEQLVLKIVLGVGLGITAAVLSKLSTGSDWDGKKFAFSIATGIISALTFVSDAGTIDETNILGIAVTNLGGQFLLNKGISAVSRLKPVEEK